MGMSFKTSSGGDPLSIIVPIRQALEVNAEDMRYMIERQKARIIDRTTRGVDVNGRTFVGYSPAYAKRRSKSGRSSSVNLTWSGRMLKALVVKEVSRNSATIGVYGEEGVRAAAHNAGEGKMPQREFIGASPEDAQLMLNDISARMMARAKGGRLNAA